MNTTPQPNLPSVEEVDKDIKELEDYFLSFNNPAHIQEYFKSWLKKALTARDAAHKEAMGEMVRAILAKKVTFGGDNGFVNLSDIKAIARSRGVDDAKSE